MPENAELDPAERQRRHELMLHHLRNEPWAFSMPDPMADYEEFKLQRRGELYRLTEQELRQRFTDIRSLRTLTDDFRIIRLEPPYVRLRSKHTQVDSFCETTWLNRSLDRLFFNFRLMHDTEFAG